MTAAYSPFSARSQRRAPRRPDLAVPRRLPRRALHTKRRGERFSNALRVTGL